MSTLREWLTQRGFDFENGIILYQAVTNPDCAPGWAYEDRDREETVQIDASNEILDRVFDSGYGGPDCPRIFARDNDAIYFPSQYDGATWLERVEINPESFIGNKKPTPYPGGG